MALQPSAAGAESYASFISGPLAFGLAVIECAQSRVIVRTMLNRRVGGPLSLLLLAAVACAPETAASPATRPPPAAVGGNGGLAGAGGTGPVAPPPVPGPVGAAGEPGVIIRPTPLPDVAIRQEAEATPGAVDIVWVIDGSGSMADEQAAVQKNIASFAAAIGGAGIDHHVVMVARDNVAGGTPLGADPLVYRHVSENIGSHDALQKLLDTYAQYADFLRPAAALHFVFVTDDDSRLSAAEFRTQMEALAGKSFMAHAIVSESVDGRACVGACGLSLLCGASSPGLQYLALADATSGQKASICVSDWSTVFEPLKTAVIESAPLPCEYSLPAAPAGASLDLDRVNVDVLLGGASMKTLPRAPSSDACADAEAWFYDDPSSPTLIKMCPAACSSVSGGGSIEISLGCETISLN
jgi:hypothetical protein